MQMHIIKLPKIQYSFIQIVAQLRLSLLYKNTASKCFLCLYKPYYSIHTVSLTYCLTVLLPYVILQSLSLLFTCNYWRASHSFWAFLGLSLWYFIPSSMKTVLSFASYSFCLSQWQEQPDCVCWMMQTYRCWCFIGCLIIILCTRVCMKRYAYGLSMKSCMFIICSVIIGPIKRSIWVFDSLKANTMIIFMWQYGCKVMIEWSDDQ